MGWSRCKLGLEMDDLEMMYVQMLRIMKSLAYIAFSRHCPNVEAIVVPKVETPAHLETVRNALHPDFRE
jgi:citrate lyase beta subunit